MTHQGKEAQVLVNHASARMTPAIFVILSFSWNLRSNALVLLGRMQNSPFSLSSSKPPSSWQGTNKHGLLKALPSFPCFFEFLVFSSARISLFFERLSLLFQGF